MAAATLRVCCKMGAPQVQAAGRCSCLERQLQVAQVAAGFTSTSGLRPARRRGPLTRARGWARRLGGDGGLHGSHLVRVGQHPLQTAELLGNLPFSAPATGSTKAARRQARCWRRRLRPAASRDHGGACHEATAWCGCRRNVSGCRYGRAGAAAMAWLAAAGGSKVAAAVAAPGATARRWGAAAGQGRCPAGWLLSVPASRRGAARCSLRSAAGGHGHSGRGSGGGLLPRSGTCLAVAGMRLRTGPGRGAALEGPCRQSRCPGCQPRGPGRLALAAFATGLRSRRPLPLRGAFARASLRRRYGGLQWLRRCSGWCRWPAGCCGLPGGVGDLPSRFRGRPSLVRGAASVGGRAFGIRVSLRRPRHRCRPRRWRHGCRCVRPGFRHRRPPRRPRPSRRVCGPVPRRRRALGPRGWGAHADENFEPAEETLFWGGVWARCGLGGCRLGAALDARRVRGAGGPGVRWPPGPGRRAARPLINGARLLVGFL